MLNRMVKLAGRLDRIGIYEDADFITEVVRRTAADIKKMRKEAQVSFNIGDKKGKALNKKHEELVGDQIDSQPLDALPKATPAGYGMAPTPGGHMARPELIPMLVLDESGREILPLETPDQILAVKNIFEVIASNPNVSQEENNQAMKLVQTLNKVMTKGRARGEAETLAYGDFGMNALKGKAILRGEDADAEMMAGKGTETRRNLFIPIPEIFRRRKNVVQLLKAVTSNGRQVGELELWHDSSNPDKKPGKSDYHDVIWNNRLNQGVGGKLIDLAKLRKEIPLDSQQRPSRTFTDKDFYVWYNDFLERVRTGNLTNEDYALLNSYIEEHMHRFDMPVEEAAEYAWARFIGEGSQNVVKDSGRRNFHYDDVKKIQQKDQGGAKKKHIRSLPKHWKHLDQNGRFIEGDEEDFDEPMFGGDYPDAEEMY